MYLSDKLMCQLSRLNIKNMFYNSILQTLKKKGVKSNFLKKSLNWLGLDTLLIRDNNLVVK